MIENEAQLRAAVADAGGLIQQITDYVAEHPEHEAVGRVRFPRGFLRTTGNIRRRLEFVEDETLRRNVSYAIMTHDVLRWLAFRTDIAGQAREMLIKEAVCLLGSICESISIFPDEHGLGRGSGFRRRLRRLQQNDVIDAEAVEVLDWLWEKRNQEHLVDLEFREWSHYSNDDWLKSVRAYNLLAAGLRRWRRQMLAHG